jgi:hypothetical protein
MQEWFPLEQLKPKDLHCNSNCNAKQNYAIVWRTMTEHLLEPQEKDRLDIYILI